VPSADSSATLTAAEVQSLFADLSDQPVLILAVSGGPDSTALLWLAAHWRKAIKGGPKLIAVTVDHGLRPEAKKEAVAVKQLAHSLRIEHQTLRWSGRKPSTGLSEAARLARYRLIGRVADDAGARYVLTAHTRDDQAETVLMRLAHGSGIKGLAAMARVSGYPSEVYPADGDGWQKLLVRPFLDVPKGRLVGTLREAGVAYADDPTNRDPRFTRPRLRAAMPLLEREGLSRERVVRFARRMRRVDDALEDAVEDATVALGSYCSKELKRVEFSAAAYARLSAEVALRLLGRAIEQVGNEGPVELGKLEALFDAFAASSGTARLRRTLAGAVITRIGDRMTVERAPPRRSRQAGPASKRP
jgi:tRNA(Ile)-lysidine synthase